jgi:hypothetical protein
MQARPEGVFLEAPSSPLVAVPHDLPPLDLPGVMSSPSLRPTDSRPSSPVSPETALGLLLGLAPRKNLGGVLRVKASSKLLKRTAEVAAALEEPPQLAFSSIAFHDSLSNTPTDDEKLKKNGTQSPFKELEDENARSGFFDQVFSPARGLFQSPLFASEDVPRSCKNKRRERPVSPNPDNKWEAPAKKHKSGEKKKKTKPRLPVCNDYLAPIDGESLVCDKCGFLYKDHEEFRWTLDQPSILEEPRVKLVVTQRIEASACQPAAEVGEVFYQCIDRFNVLIYQESGLVLASKNDATGYPFRNLPLTHIKVVPESQSSH